ncbi:hypothetical protein KKC91_06530 [bacterium]|nr:hypothetical protein [bacterium]
MTKMQQPSFIYLYDGGKTKSLNVKEIAISLRKRLRKAKVEIREDFIPKENFLETTARELASIKISDIKKKDTFLEPLPVEINYEKRRLMDSGHKAAGILYDGFRMLSIFAKLIPKIESNFNYCHIIFTNQLFGTWDENDLRYHARVAVFGFPSIISTTGVVEAPAKPREFYLKRQMGMNFLALKEEFKGRFIDYDDSRLTEVMKGYSLQALLFHMTGDPFCKDKNCRLYNAHWQEEVIHAQLKSEYELCNFHEKILTKTIIR